MTVSMKRKRNHDDREVEIFAMDNCLMLLSRRLDNKNSNGQVVDSFSGRVFRCKTCDKEFYSFQALGGHRASHKRPKLFASDLLNNSPSKPKTHECSICGLDFSVGQALGGHMKRHRGEKTVEVMPVVRKSNGKKVLVFDLNLTPLENDLNLGNQPSSLSQSGFKFA